VDAAPGVALEHADALDVFKTAPGRHFKVGLLRRAGDV
jgi:hypothetical protein